VFTTSTSGAKKPGCHGYPARRLAISGVQLALDQVSSLPWNHCPVSRGLGVQFAVESVSTLAWNTQVATLGQINRAQDDAPETRNCFQGLTLPHRSRGQESGSRPEKFAWASPSVVGLWSGGSRSIPRLVAPSARRREIESRRQATDHVQQEARTRLWVSATCSRPHYAASSSVFQDDVQQL
jgi:hypothetical protein